MGGDAGGWFSLVAGWMVGAMEVRMRSPSGAGESRMGSEL